jgi:hypothetical protein
MITRVFIGIRSPFRAVFESVSHFAGDAAALPDRNFHNAANAFRHI